MVGGSYVVTFNWAASQQCCAAQYPGQVTDSWLVGFAPTVMAPTTTAANGTTIRSTNSVTPTAQTTSGWFQSQFAFTATASTMVLSFLAQGSPSGQPPFSLLDGVTLVAVPEPATSAILVTGLAALFGLRRAKRRKS